MNTRKTRVAVLAGGPSSEHDVSLSSGRVVCANLDKDRYEVLPIFIDRKGNWSVPLDHLSGAIDVVFIAMHGEYGEDGTVQELLSQVGIPYTGSDHRASALAMNKALTRRLFAAHGIKGPNFQTIYKHHVKDALSGDISLPAIVKPLDRGSSVGVNIVRSHRDLQEALSKALALSRAALIEEYIGGREVTCAVIDSGMGHPFPLPVTEIKPKAGRFFDYASKYSKGASEEITPANLTRRETGLVQAVALRAHQLVGAHGFSRTDMILGEDGEIYVLEINTIPGLTETSLLPQGALCHGMSLSELFDTIIESALVRELIVRKK